MIRIYIAFTFETRILLIFTADAFSAKLHFNATHPFRGSDESIRPEDDRQMCVDLGALFIAVTVII